MLRTLTFVFCGIYSLTTFASESVKRPFDPLQHHIQADKRQRTEDVHMDTGEALNNYLMGSESIRTYSSINQRAFQALLNQNINEFIKSLPELMHTTYPSESNLRNFYLSTFKNSKLADSIPNSASASESLANILLELEIWVHIGYLVEDHISYQCKDQHWEQTKKILWQHIGSRSRDQIKEQVWDHISSQIKTHLCYKIWFKVMELCKSQLKNQLWNQVDVGLQQFGLSKANASENKDEVLKPAIDLIFITYQLGGLPMRYSEDFKEIKMELAEFISRNMTEDQIINTLNNINIPDYTNDLLTAPLEIITIMLSSID